jgi:hypothetical protein
MTVTPKIIVIDKSTHIQAVVTGLDVSLSRNSIVALNIPRAQIRSLARQGSDLVITTAEGQVIIVHGYFVHDANTLIIQDNDGLWSSDLSSLDALSGDSTLYPSANSHVFTHLDSLGSLLDSTSTVVDPGTPAAAAATTAAANVLAWIPLALAGAGIAVAASGSSNSSPTPVQGALQIGNIAHNPSGTLTVSGTAQPGDTVTVTYPDGSTAIGTVDANGNYAVTSQSVGKSGTVSVLDTTSGDGTHATWSDTTPPQAPTVTVTGNAGGILTVIGTAEQGSTVTVTFADGSTVTTVAGANGNYRVTSGTAETSGAVSVTATDAAGNTSAATTASTATTPPQAPQGAFFGATAFGMAEPGSTITVTYPDGSTVTGTAAANGVFSITNSMSVSPGNSVSITAANAAGASPPQTVQALHATGALPPANPDGT